MEEVTNYPVFIGIRARSGTNPLFHAITLDNVNPKFPIRMPLKTIFKLYDVNFAGENLTEAAFQLNINIIMREIIDKKAYKTKNTNGQLWGPEKSIKIGFDDKNYYWLPLSFKDSTYICSKTQSCFHSVDDRKDNFQRHEETCSDKTTIETKQRSYGLYRTPLTDVIEAGYLPDYMNSYRHSWLVTYDIESIEIPKKREQTEWRQVEGYQSPVSIAVYSNLPGTEEKWFYQNDSPQSIKLMIHEFVEYLFELQMKLEDQLPIEFEQAIDKIQDSITENKGNKFEQQKLWRLKNGLERYKKLNVYGFNSGENYDLRKS